VRPARSGRPGAARDAPPTMTVVRPAPFRVARGGTVAAVGLALALAGHALAGGGAMAPDAGTALPALAVLAGCVVAAQRAWTAGRLVVALLGVQVVVHGSMWLSGGGQQVDPRLAGLLAQTAAHHHGTAAALTPGMLAAHAAALVVAALLLAGVDDAVLTLWTLGRAALGALPVATGIVTGPVVVPVTHAAALGRTRVLLVSPRRGPPALPAPC
jgi:hypothetical protein